MNHKLISLFSLVAFLILTNIAHNKNLSANDYRELGAHVHGIAHLNLAVEKNAIQADAVISGDDLLGFEHEAKTDSEKKALRQTTKMLNNKYQLLSLPATAGCEVKNSIVKNSSSTKNHMDFEIEVQYKCLDTSKVRGIEVHLFKNFKNLKEINVRIITDHGQKSYYLTSTNNKFLL